MNLTLPTNWCDDEEQLVLHRLFCSNSLIAYIRAIAPWFIVEEVHCVIASYLEAVANGEIDRLWIFACPRTGKSMMSSVLFPSWWAGKFPTDKIMQIGYKTDLPKRFSRQVRNIVMSREYQTIFPGVEIAQYARAAGYWNFMDINDEYHNIARAGEYQAAGVTAGIAGSGFNLGNLDDPLALHIDTPIPTTKGFKTIAELKIGDKVFGPDGRQTEVIAKSEVWKDRPLYRLTTSDGESVLCDGAHLWPYMSGGKIKVAKARDFVDWIKLSRPCLPRHRGFNKRQRSFEIAPIAKTGDVQCITVARDDGLFLCGKGYIVTHNSEQDKDSKIAKDRVWEWYGTGFYTRRQPGRNFIVGTATRWAVDDLAGRLIDASRHGGDKFEILNIPAILDGETARKMYLIAKGYDAIEAKELKAGESFSPVRIPTKELLRSKANMTTRDWLALYMGAPIEDEGAIIKVAWWKLWPKEEPPECVFIFQMYDTAFEEHESADYSAMTTWGVFEYTGRDGRATFNMILLGKWKRRVEAPELPKVVTAFCHGSDIFEEKDRKEVIELCRGEGSKTKVIGHHPDSVMIENKASGIWLIKELRKRTKPAIPVRPWNPPRGTTGEKGKYARAQLATLVFEQGAVWYMDKEWAAEVIDEVGKCRFDGSDESDDLGDTVTAAVIYVRQSYRVETESEINEKAEAEAELERSKSEKRYYGSR